MRTDLSSEFCHDDLNSSISQDEQMDRLDLNILAALSREGRLSMAELAARV
ncbi:MAG: AsnC family transcriptional regulator, partial [Rhizobiaceae bacterium]